MEIKGSCLCGAVQFVIEGAPGGMGVCHCSRCRKLGTSTMVFVKRTQFRLTAGADKIGTMVPEPPYSFQRSFCKMCGTALGEPLSPDDSFPINAQCLDDDPGVRISFHEHVENKPVWAKDEETA